MDIYCVGHPQEISRVIADVGSHVEDYHPIPHIGTREPVFTVPFRIDEQAPAYGVPSATLTSDPATLPDCDALLLATPVGVRTGYYEAFAKKGVAVLAEKPFSTSSAEHARLMRLFPSHRIGCGYIRRMYRTVALLRQVIAEG